MHGCMDCDHDLIKRNGSTSGISYGTRLIVITVLDFTEVNFIGYCKREMHITIDIDGIYFCKRDSFQFVVDALILRSTISIYMKDGSLSISSSLIIEGKIWNDLLPSRWG
jgi:hypothetical protein